MENDTTHIIPKFWRYGPTQQAPGTTAICIHHYLHPSPSFSGPRVSALNCIVHLPGFYKVAELISPARHFQTNPSLDFDIGWFRNHMLLQFANAQTTQVSIQILLGLLFITQLHICRPGSLSTRNKINIIFQCNLNRLLGAGCSWWNERTSLPTWQAVTTAHMPNTFNAIDWTMRTIGRWFSITIGKPGDPFAFRPKQ